MIYFVKILKESFKFHLFRTILTGLGIFIGITAVIIILTISKSFSNHLINQYSSNTTIGLIADVNSSTDLEEAIQSNEIQTNIGNARKIPGVRKLDEDFLEETVDIYVESEGVYKENIIAEFKDIIPTEGVSFDERSGNVVIVRNNEEFGFPYKIKDVLFINNESYEIIGITDELGDTNASVYFPTNLKEHVTLNENSASGILDLIVDNRDDFEDVKQSVLMELNKGLDGDLKFVDYSEETNKAIEESIGTISIFLALIGAISIIVAGINVVNMMYISTLEKMNEIAIYRALGMSKKMVIQLFLMESLILVFTFSILGYGFGLLISAIILTILNVNITVSFIHILLVFIISFVLGLGSGIKPAINAANADPATLLK